MKFFELFIHKIDEVYHFACDIFQKSRDPKLPKQIHDTQCGISRVQIAVFKIQTKLPKIYNQFVVKRNYY